MSQTHPGPGCAGPSRTALPEGRRSRPPGPAGVPGFAFPTASRLYLVPHPPHFPIFSLPLFSLPSSLVPSLTPGLAGGCQGRFHIYRNSCPARSLKNSREAGVWKGGNTGTEQKRSRRSRRKQLPTGKRFFQHIFPPVPNVWSSRCWLNTVNIFYCFSTKKFEFTETISERPAMSVLPRRWCCWIKKQAQVKLMGDLSKDGLRGRTGPAIPSSKFPQIRGSLACSAEWSCASMLIYHPPWSQAYG
ncbi:uncharacterized protein LOC113480967 [Athene cunicularia]|uniref:uncharacterized protein LOC113480967 n=1 Tax=Athene cunicularia TaxID=194338 RepID=UPI000EF68C5A|nr:uncharacterized protein LOC113480967 [Athene cunicularia]